MLTLLQHARCFCPEYAGEKDIVIAGDRIHTLAAPGTIGNSPLFSGVYDCRGLFAFPGLIDQHIHIMGAGGEDGFQSRTRALEAQEILNAGVTTVVGLLGADGVTRSMPALYAQAKRLETQGLTTYIYSGSYTLPPVTLMGSLQKDIMFIDKVVGAGEIAVSDHRASNPDAQELTRLAAQVHLGGFLAGKAGVLHLHVGDGKGGLEVLRQVLTESDLPPEMFVPTHVNRNRLLFRQAVEYWSDGGNIDLTAGEAKGLSVPEAVGQLAGRGIGLSRVTVSSDAGGSVPSGGTGLIGALYSDFMEIIKQSVLPPEEAVRLFTEYPAAVLKLFPKKGALREGSDADILLTDENLGFRLLFAMGRLLIDKRD